MSLLLAKAIDFNGSGIIDWEEFLAVMLSSSDFLLKKLKKSSDSIRVQTTTSSILDASNNKDMKVRYLYFFYI